MISIHKALAGLDDIDVHERIVLYISIHKALAGLDVAVRDCGSEFRISIHKALAGLDKAHGAEGGQEQDFNPQGPRGPRRLPARLRLTP